jgi:hypothetical protein
MINVVIELLPVLSAHDHLASWTALKVALAFLCLSLAAIHANYALCFSLPNVDSVFGTVFIGTAAVSGTNAVAGIWTRMDRAIIMSQRLDRLVWIHGHLVSNRTRFRATGPSRMPQLSFDAMKNPFHHGCCCRGVATLQNDVVFAVGKISYAI